MRIAQFLPHYPAPGGTTKAVGGISNALASAGHHVEIWTLSSFPAPSQQAQVLAFPSWYDLNRHIRERARDYDVTVLNGMFNPALVRAARAIKRAGGMYVVALHGSYHPALMAKGRLRKALYWPFERAMLHGAEAAQVLSDDAAVHLKANGIRTPAFTIPNGYDENEVADPVQPTPSDKTRLLYLGRVEPNIKGVDLLLSAVAPAADTQLDLVGPAWGPLPQTPKNTRLLGPNYIDPARKIIGGYDVLVAPSRFDGFGFSVLEAMLNATPVIVTTECGIAEHVKAARAGWVVAPTADSLLEAIQLAKAAKDEWCSIGMRGREYVLANLSWRQSAARAAKAYAMCRVYAES